MNIQGSSNNATIETLRSLSTIPARLSCLNSLLAAFVVIESQTI